jgi:hypothetical protein
MINLVEFVRKLDERRKISSKTLLREADWSFCRLVDIQYPILAEWRGCLPACKKARHLLRVEKLTGWQARDASGKIVVPFRAFPEATHQFWGIYQMVDDSARQYILFSFQMDCKFDTIALQIGESLAKIMINSKSPSQLIPLNTQTSYQMFWEEMAAFKLEEALEHKTS